MNVNVEKTIKEIPFTRTFSITCTLAGTPATASREVPVGDAVRIDDYGAWLKPAFGGSDVCNYIKDVSFIDKVQTSKGTTIDGPYKPVCNEVSYIYMGFARE